VLADGDLEDDDRRHLARHHAHAQVELLGQIGVGVEQITVGGPRSAPLAHAAGSLCELPRCGCDDAMRVPILSRNRRGNPAYDGGW
jgi:hypothetical protein